MKALSIVCVSIFPLIASAWTPSDEAPPMPLDSFVVPEGMEVIPWAASPMLNNPTNMDIDSKGRVWVTEGVNYRHKSDRRPAGDRIVILEDTDADGKADKSTVFWQDPELIVPLGIAIFDNVVMVSQPPNLLKLIDVDRDGVFNEEKGDKKEVFLTGFNGRNHDHSLHSVTGSPDGKLVFNQGNMAGAFTDADGKSFVFGGPYIDERYSKNVVDSLQIAGEKSDDGFAYNAGAAFRINADGTRTEVIGHGFRNSYEQITDSLGFIFQNDNDDPPACRVTHMLEHGNAGYFSRDGKKTWGADRRPGQEIPIAHWRQEDPGTMPAGDVYGGGSPTGIAMYENGILGDEFIGTLLSCEPGRNVIFGYKPELIGAGFRLDRKDFVTTNPEKVFDGADFAGSDSKMYDPNSKEVSLYQFRPSDVAVGTDGAIYIADWTDSRVGGHGTRDDAASGIIYRLAPKGFTPDNPQIDFTTVPGAITALKSPAVNVRWTGFHFLKDKGEQVFDQVISILENENKFIAARAIWLLPHMGEKGVMKLEELLSEEDQNIRLTAFRAIRRSDGLIDPLLYARSLAEDPSPAVRAECALEMRYRSWEEAEPILVKVAMAYDGKDPSYLESLGLGAGHHNNELWASLKVEMAPENPADWTEKFARLTWRLTPKAAVPELKERALDESLSEDARKIAVTTIAFVNERSAADAMIELAEADSPIQDQAVWWLRNRVDGEWAAMDLEETLIKNGTIEENVKMISIEVPRAPKKMKFTTESVLALNGDAARGKIAAGRCLMCHQIDGQGVEYGPALLGFGKRQPPEVVIRSIIDPSYDISHGYDGHRLNLYDGGPIDGQILSEGKDIMIRSTGGVTQKVPSDQIKSRRPLKQSLMLSADQLGMTAQDVADVAEWMKSY